MENVRDGAAVIHKLSGHRVAGGLINVEPVAEYVSGGSRGGCPCDANGVDCAGSWDSCGRRQPRGDGTREVGHGGRVGPLASGVLGDNFDPVLLVCLEAHQRGSRGGPRDLA